MNKRTLAIFGITGQTGRVVAEMAMKRGWAVRGLARPESAKAFAVSGATIVSGHFSDADLVAQAVDNADAVCCVIGPRPPYIDAFCANATAAIIAAMRRNAVKRIVCQTGAMIGQGNLTIPFSLLAKLVAHRQSAVISDRLEQERVIMESGLAWTLVKPPRLTNAHVLLPVRAEPNLRIGLLSRISRVSLANFILDTVDDDSLLAARLYVRE